MKETKKILTISAIALILAISYQSRNEIMKTISAMQWWQLSLATISLTLANIGMALTFSELLPTTLPPKKRLIVGTFLLSQVGKYMPGRVWGIVMQAAILHKTGPTSGIFTANIELTIANLIIATGIGTSFLAWPTYGPTPAIAILIATWVAANKSLSINFSRKIERTALRIIPKFYEKFTRKITTTHTISTRPTRPDGLLLYIITYSIGWWLLAKATTNLDAAACMKIVAALSLSYIAGVISLLPAGIGVREGTLILLSPALGATHESMTALAVSSRAIMILMDIMTACIGSALLKSQNQEA